MGKTANAGHVGRADEAERETTAAGADGVDLEAGIASIFAAIRSGGDAVADGELPEDSGATYDLLARLDQLWQASGSGEA